MPRKITIPKTTITKFNRSIIKEANSVLRVMRKKCYKNANKKKIVEVPGGDFSRIMNHMKTIIDESGSFNQEVV